MRVAGVGFREAAPLASLIEAVRAASGGAALDALATVTRKADAPVLRALATVLGLPVIGVEVSGQPTESHSDRIAAGFGTGSVAEAAALVGAGEGARLLAPRVRSADGMAVAAVAEGKGLGT